MGWVFLACAGICEIVYAAAMPRTDGFTRLWPSLFCGTFIALSMYLLSLAIRTIPVGTATYGVLALGEDRSLPRMLCFAFIIADIAGLKVLSFKSTCITPGLN